MADPMATVRCVFDFAQAGEETNAKQNADKASAKALLGGGK